jgi:hypothetical protein
VTKKWVSSLLRIALGLAIGICALIGGAVAYSVAMPGTSIREPLPALSPAEAEVEKLLRAHVNELAVDIGQRRAVFGDSLKRAEQYLHEQLAQPAASLGAKLRREALAGE